MKKIPPPLRLLRKRLQVPPSLYENKNFIEAEAVTERICYGKKEVLGTANSQRVELYGWKNPVGMHRDKEQFKPSYVYFCLLRGEVQIGLRDKDNACYWETPAVGQIIRMDECMEHWTTGFGQCVALFCGTYSKTCDAQVTRMMEIGIRRLAANIRGPRVALHYTFLFNHGECLVNRNNIPRLSTVRVAERLNQEIIVCSKCYEPATRVDPYYPYAVDRNRCLAHLSTP